MKKIQSKDIREVLKYNGDIVVDEYNYLTLVLLYNDYLKYKDIKLTYNDIDLKEYAKSHKHGIGNPEREEKWEELADKEIKKIHKMLMKAHLISCLIFAEAAAGIINYSNHDYINIENSKYIIENYSKDTNGDGIKELHSSDFGEYDGYIEPTSDFLYAITNPLYYISDKNKISNADSMKDALKELNIKVIDFDNEFYTPTGKLSYVTYELDDGKYLLNLPYMFDSKEHAEEVIASFLDKRSIEGYSNIDYIGTIDVKDYDELPTIYQSKKDNSITTKESNKVLYKIKKFIK